MNNIFSSFGMGAGVPTWAGAFAPLLPFLLILFLWAIFWKGLALWHSGRKGNAGWFVVLLFINTLGILEVIYLFGVLKLKLSQLFSK